MKSLRNAIIVGVLTVILGEIYGFTLGRYLSVPLPEVCQKWNKYYVMEITLFLAGATAYLVTQLII
jgi:hypothetical protein